MDTGSQELNCNSCTLDVKCLNRLVPGEQDFEVANKVMVIYLKGEILCKVGGFPSGVKTVLEGFVKVFVEGPGHRNIIMKILSPGEFLGLASICGCVTYSYTATALNECLVCSIERDTVMDLIGKNGKFAYEIAKWYCVNYDRAYAKISSLGFKRLPGRMADVLFYLDQPRLRLHAIYEYLSRKELADMAGISTESAVRILSEFDKSGIISLSGKEISILDHSRLEHISHSG
ncbi:MAG: Crp/Fnr family transcriptional regulator [Bacteroidia bacterium]|nr:MAG: Crp/Fnr family transcriptional regulator [Bacteroidia bacterium]